MKEKVASLARLFFGFSTLETLGRDQLDFREVAVWNVKAALEKAYEAGLKAGKESK